MIEFLSHLVFWHWWILAIGMVILEVLAPGVIFLWLGIGAGLMGGILLFVPDLGWKWQLVGFAILSIASGIGGRVWMSAYDTETDEPNLNRRGDQYVGREFTLDGPIVNGVGKLKVGDSNWRISGGDMPEGCQVKVVSVEGITLRVERL